MILAVIVLVTGSPAPALKGQTPGASCPGSFTCDFEEGNLRGWTGTGTAFGNQPTLGDNPTARQRGQPSNHQGRWWIGTFENYQGRPGQTPGQVQGDEPRGTLTSARFVIPSGILTFLIGGGADPATRVELMVHDHVGTQVLRASGSNTETMRRVRWDLAPYAGKTGFIRIVDDSSGPWGHINVDDFLFMGNIVELPGQPTTTTPGIVILEPPHTAAMPQPPVARIEPSFQRVPAGQSVTFRSLSEAGVGATMRRISWKGPGDQTATGPEFPIDTQGLAAGNYEIALLVLNTRGQTARATARLEVSAREINVSLIASKTVVQINEEVVFTTLSNVSDQGPAYLFRFGDEQPSGWTQAANAQHGFAHPGTYSVQAHVRLAGRTAASNAVTITVEEEPQIAEGEDDSHRIDRSEAEQGVTEGPEPPVGIMLGVEPNPAKAGAEVRLFARTHGQPEGAEYQFRVDGTVIRDWSPDPGTEYVFRNKGTYTATAMMRAGDVFHRQSEPVEIRIGVAIPPSVYVVLVLLAATGAYGFIRSHRRGKGLKERRLFMQVIPRPDAGTQTFEAAVPSGALPAVSVRPVLDKGEQSIDIDDLLIR